MPRSEARFFLIIKAPNGDVREVPLGDSSIVLGRDDSADVRVDDKKVSRRHVTFKLTDGEPWVEDLGSANGIRLNGKRVSKRAKFGLGDEIRVGSYHVTLKDLVEHTGSNAKDEEDIKPVTGTAQIKPRVIERSPEKKPEELPTLLGLDAPVKGKSFSVRLGENIVGRLEECDVPILDGSVSRQHARIVYSKDRVTVTDLGSANGIFLNDVRVDLAELADGDRLKIGSIKFEVRLPAALAIKGTLPVHARVKPSKKASSSYRGLVLGAFAVFLAAFVVAGALYWRRRAHQEHAPLPPLLAKLERALGLAQFPEGQTFDAGVAPRPDAGATAVYATRPGDAGLPVAVPSGERSDAGAAVEPPPPPPPPPELAALPPVGTASSPFSRRDANGLPMFLPEVERDFDFDAFVNSQLEAARSCEGKPDSYACVKQTLTTLLARDPINSDARALLKKADQLQAAQQALTRADKLAARGEFAAALRALAEIGPELPQAEAAKVQTEKIRQLAIEDELGQGEKELKNKASWQRAHERFSYVLSMDPDSERALDGLRKVEAKMRDKNMDFNEYRAPNKDNKDNPPPQSPGDLTDALKRHHGGDMALVRIAEAYARGALPKALATAEAEEKKPKADKRRIREMSADLKRIQAQYERTKAEISNDPRRAWAMLTNGLLGIEARILPPGIKSFLVKDLEHDLSDAFAERGMSALDSQRLEEAFQGFEAGYKLDSNNPKVRAGLKKLEEKAKAIATEAEIAAQRGDRTVCDRWKRITNITTAESEIYQKARKRISDGCR